MSNEETGGKGEIRISNNAVNKFLSESAVEKSDSKDVHMSVLKVLPNVIRESIDAEQHPDYKKGEDGNRNAGNGINEHVTIHRLYGAVNIDGKTYMVKVTLKEDRTNNEPQKAYSYEATKIELLAGQHGDVSMTPPRNSNNSITVSKLLNGVEKSYGNGEKLLDYSKVVDENGEPMVVYHGTSNNFYTFDINKLGSATGNKGWYGAGFYFTPDEKPARGYASNSITLDKLDLSEDDKKHYLNYIKYSGTEKGYDYSSMYERYLNAKEKAIRVIPAFLNIRNPHYETRIMNFGEFYKGAEGTDGVIATIDIKGKPQIYEIKVTDPTQIKSAMENEGIFDSTNPDMRKREGNGVATDNDVVMAVDQVSKVLGSPRGTAQQRKASHTLSAAISMRIIISFWHKKIIFA